MLFLFFIIKILFYWSINRMDILFFTVKYINLACINFLIYIFNFLYKKHIKPTSITTRIKWLTKVSQLIRVPSFFLCFFSFVMKTRIRKCPSLAVPKKKKQKEKSIFIFHQGFYDVNSCLLLLFTALCIRRKLLSIHT